MTAYLWKGVLIGLLFGLPAGAVGALTVQRTLRYGPKAGLLTGLGSSAADCFYASLGALGLTFISDFLLQYKAAIYLVGGGLILFLGIGLLCRKEDTPGQEGKDVGRWRSFFSSFAIGITNPAAILTFLFAFSWFGLSGGLAFGEGALLVFGVFLGTYLWWGALTVAASFAKKKTNTIEPAQMNRLFGVILCLLGAVVWLRLIL
ncbi:LysE family translocator [Anaerotruncus colihominis]|uniref:Lysine transporter LysE n=1 Tax=Anaerotruncus colihominis TaxID=169435 RepID=A0A845SYC3_9FIRM|nr:LysE family transporter [Anaerotruncus colihominis]MCR2024179.1 LysE family transporter [Anaerotruncus colihominis]NDO39272.1 lysine transporter LysE [Anaerotruncus colihominis]